MHPCKICNRKFNNTERLDKHMTVCEKASKPRRTFDASKARVKGTELEQFAGKKKVEPVIKKSNWREKREGFLKMVRSAKDPGQNSEPVENPDYIMCEFCERKFNEIAAARHIPICKESKLKQQMRMGFSTKSSPVKDDERKKRLAFKAPLPKGKSPK